MELPTWNPKSYRVTSTRKRPSLQELLFGSSGQKSIENIFKGNPSKQCSSSTELPTESQRTTQNSPQKQCHSTSFSRTAPQTRRNRLDKFLDKFSPSFMVLSRCFFNIFGVVLFTRLPIVFGDVGVAFGVLIVLLCESIVFTTDLSLSAIVTNGQVESGGVYFLVSRALGPEFGFTIGLQFYLANCISTAMYLLGFSETFLLIFGLDFQYDSQAVAMVAITVIFCCDLFQTQLVLAFQILFVLPLILLGILSVVFGIFFSSFSGESSRVFAGFTFGNLKNNLIIPNQKAFFTAMAIFFPGTLGMIGGANYLEKLRKPEKAFPKGSLTAIIISTLTYLLMGILLCFSVTRINLQQGEMLMADLSLSKWIVYLSVFFSALSQAFTNFSMAPGILLQISRDNLISFLGFFTGRKANLKVKIVTFLVTIMFILPGKFDNVAPFVTSIAIITYSVLNFACFLQTVQKTPNWRPSFRFYNAFVSLITAIAFIVMMFFMNYLAGIFSLVVTGVLMGIMVVIRPKVDWDGVMNAVLMNNAVSLMKRLDRINFNPKNYRMQVMAFCGTEFDHLVDFCRVLLKRGKVVSVLTHVIVQTSPSANSYTSFLRREQIKGKWTEKLKGICFHKIIFSGSLLEGIDSLLQIVGTSIIEPNTVLMGFKEDWNKTAEKIEEFASIIKTSMLYNKAVLIIRRFEDFDFDSHYRNETLDVWWFEEDGGLTILIPYIISLSRVFPHSKLRVIEILSGERIKTNASIGRLLIKLRIPAIVQPVKIDSIAKLKGKKTLRMFEQKSGKSLPSDQRLLQYLAVAEEIRKVSFQSLVTFVTLPVARFAYDNTEYLSVLECLSQRGKVVFVRGNQENVLTHQL